MQTNPTDAPDALPAPDFNYPAELPVSSHRDEILAALARHPVVIVCGDTGSGKTTQLPKMALEHLLAAASARPVGPAARLRVACTQPRRLAAVTMAARVAHELKSPVGGLVGYQHRFGRRLSRDTRIKFMTDGVLLAETRTDPLLRAYDVVIVDEAHERSLNVDFLLGILTRILARRRDLKVVVSSATLDVVRFSEYFNKAPVISVPGRLFPIDIRYRPPREDDERDLPRDVAAAVATLPPRDDVLVFLPGERDIRETADALARLRGCDEIIPLLASLPAAEQQRAFRLSDRRRIILATNVAETSVTIPGIRCVIDSGLARISRYVHRTQVQRLQIEPISQASARQRAGRCGRLGPGICIRLYSEDDFNARDPYTPPEILRASLAGVILTLLDLRLGDVERFPFLDPPRPVLLHEGLRELLELNAIAHRPRNVESGKLKVEGSAAETRVVLTDIGRKLARIPLEPRLARMLLAAADNAILPTALPIVAALACDDPRRRPVDAREKAAQAHAPFRVPGSDFLSTRKLWLWWQSQTAGLSQAKARALAKKTYLSYPKMREWRDLVNQLTDLATRLGLSFAETVLPARKNAPKGTIPQNRPDGELDPDASARLHRALLTGLLGRIGLYDPEARNYRGAHGLRFYLHPSSVLMKKAKAPDAAPTDVVNAHAKPKAPAAKPSCPPWVMAGELVDTARLFARNAAVLDPTWIEPVAGTLAKHTYHSPEWDPQTGFVRATEQVTLYGLVIVPARRCDFSRVNLPLARELFIRHALVLGDFPHPPSEMRPNLRLLDALRRRAEKARRPEFFDVERLVAHFAAVLPPDVASIPALRKWLARGDCRAFQLRKADWWPHESAGETDFPDAIRIGGVKMSLSYRNTPEDPETDGITCTVRRSDAAALRLWRADWLVPGALPEKLAYLISALPSAQRRVLTPIGDTVSGLLAHLKPGAEPLEDAVRHAILAHWGFHIPADAWAQLKLPPHLRVRFRVRDDATGRVLACSRDLETVLAAAGGTADGTAAAPKRHVIALTPQTIDPQNPATFWPFGTLPEKTADAEAGWKLEHFPALHDEGPDKGVSLRLYGDAATAELEQAAGLTRLYLLALGERARIPFLRKKLSVGAQLYLKTLNYDSVQISADILAGAVREAYVRNQPPVRDAATFRRRLEENRNTLAAAQFEMGEILGAAYAAAARIDARLDEGGLPDETVDAVRTQLAWLLYPGFPKNVPLARLRNYARYLRGAALRLDRARTNPAGDRAKEAKFAPYWVLYTEAVQGKSSVKFAARPLAEFRWMLEEFRISLFAQELHTSEPVSPKRLDAKLAEAAID